MSVDVSGVGVQELAGSNTCSSFENNSIWLEINIATDGTLAFTLTPDSDAITEDYDFFIFGPDVSCGNIGQAIRCSTTNPVAAGQADNLTGMNSTETDTAEGPGPDGNSFVRAIDALAGERYFIVIDRPIGNSPFSIEWTGTATFPDNPVAPVQPDLFDISSCDNLEPNDDGITTFDLTTLTQDIINNDPEVLVSYHTSESDANIAFNDLGTVFENTVPFDQTIYVRLENSVSGCFIIESLDLSINDSPIYNEPEDYTICDDLTDGDNTNGTSSFILQDITDDITAGFNPNELTVSYYNTLTEAETVTNPLANTIVVNGSRVLFVRIVSNSGCIAVDSFSITVIPVPIVTDVSFFQCDEIGDSDGFTIFNLEQFDTAISNGTADTTVAYFNSQSDAENNNSSLNSNSFSNSSNPQILFARVTNELTGCYNFATVELRTSDTSVNDSVLEACDTDGVDDGITTFNLRDADNTILIGLPPGLDLNYYPTEDDALLETNALPDSYTNSNPLNEIIFVRVEDDNNCFGIAQVELQVLSPPTLSENNSTIYCLNQFPQPITLEGGIVDDSPSNYTYEWSTGETTSQIQINEPGTYTVSVANSVGCTNERTITVLPSDVATITDINVEDGRQLNSINVSVTGEGDYEFALNNPAGPYQDEPLFENLPPELYTLYVRDKNGCGIIEEDISVIGFPRYFTPNGDGVNDYWQIKGIVSRNQLKGNILIFDRFGKLLVELDPTDRGWNGEYNGNSLPSSDYWFSATLDDGRRFTNHFALRR